MGAARHRFNKPGFKMTPKTPHPAGAGFSRLNAQKRRSARFFCGLSPAKAHLHKAFHGFNAVWHVPEW
jgi:hypothetical protein